jgi:hypothetical protein
MPAVRRSETAPRKSSRVSQLDTAKQQREQAKEQQLEKERKAEAAAERKAKAAKGKGKKKSAAAVKRKPAQKRKAAGAGENGEEEEEKEVKKPRKAPTARGGAKEDAKDVEEEKEDATGEEVEADEPAKVKGGKYKIGDVVEDVTLLNGAFPLVLTNRAEVVETRWRRGRGVEAVFTDEKQREIEDDKEVSLKQLYGETGLVIFSYPSASLSLPSLLYSSLTLFLHHQTKNRGQHSRSAPLSLRARLPPTY